ncbi:hypothetical protein CLOP_g10131 [Closterium sp. NIES-67]|nr:hypothetical protein CLOP_g10131 [Closterium sp. NIES-67]
MARSFGRRRPAPVRIASSTVVRVALTLIVALLSRRALAATDPAHLPILRSFAALGNPTSPPFNAWAGDDPCGADAGSAWPGIKCDGGGTFNVVSEIDIQDAQLAGDLPPSLFGLTTLRTINLALNPKITGSFPETLGNLLQLTTLDMHSCGLSGSIPSTIGRLTNLKYFLVNQNRLSGSLPSQMGALPHLYMLDVMDNQLEGPLPSFEGATELGHLHMSRNLFTSVPAEISQLPKLEHLLMDSNRLTHDIPLAFNNTNFTVIYWSNNIIPGPLPSTWFFPKLRDFLVSNCSLPDQPLPSFPRSVNLSNLDLSGNSFTGAIPGSLFQQSPNLVNLNLASNALDSDLPPEITTASKLQSVFLADNQLTGPLPDLSGLSSIVSLSLYDNDFTSVPPDLLERNNLTLQLYNNNVCKPFNPEYLGVCSPPTSLTQYTSPAFCDGLACKDELYTPSAPIYSESRSCVCVSPLRVDLELFISDFVVYHKDLVEQLEQRIFSELTTKSAINISRSQVLISAISSPATLYSLASTFASDHTDHESTLIVTVLFFPPAGDASWFPRDTPQAIRRALTTRDLTARVALGNFGLFRVAGFYGPAPYNPPSQQAASGLSTGAIVAISVSSAALGIALIVALLMRPWEKRGWSHADYEALEGIKLQHARRYSLKQLAEATSGFDDTLVLGEGGYGKVYKGVLNGEPVAIKKATEKRRHDGVDFKNEIEMLTAVSHGNLVKLTGFCVEKDEQLLVFEFMEGGALDAWIRGSSTERILSWRERMRIALDAANALHYLHREMKPGIIHRDIKPANILLTASLEAKVADFGISKSLPERGELVQEKIIGSRGYIDPHFAQSEVLTERSDVFSFGVVLLQLATGQPPVIQGVPLSQVVLHLAFGAGGLSSAIDPKLSPLLLSRVTPAPAAAASNRFHGAAGAAGASGAGVSVSEVVEGLEDTFGTFLRVALWCTAEHPSLRPDMEQVISALRSIRDQLRALPGAGGSLASRASSEALAAVGSAGAISSASNGFATAGYQHRGYQSNSGIAAVGSVGTNPSAAGGYPSGPRAPGSEVSALTGGPASLSTLWNPMAASSGQLESNWSSLAGEQRGMDGFDATSGTQHQTMTGPHAR